MSGILQPLAPLRRTSINGRILRAATSIGIAALAVRGCGALREFVVAGVYGRSDSMDAFLAAILLPNLLINLIAESMNQALAPTLVKVREQEGRPAAQQLLSSSMLWSCLLLTAVSLAMAAGARWIFPFIASNFVPAKLALAERLFYALLPMVLISGIAANCTTVLNTRERFGMPALAPAITPLVTLAGALAFSHRLGIWAMVWAMLAGSLLHVLIIAWLLERHGYRFRLWWHGSTAAVREVANQYGTMLLSGLLGSAGLLVDQSMAAMLPAGSVSALAYANRFISLFVLLLGGTVSLALVPYFSQMVARQDWTACRQTMKTWFWITLAASTPLALALIAGSRLLVRLAYQHGAFTPRDTAIVAPVLAMYAIQIPFYVSSRVFYRLLIAMRRTDLVMWCGVINLALDIVLNLVLMRWFGVAGIALATSLWVVATFLFLGFWARRVLSRAEAAAR